MQSSRRRIILFLALALAMIGCDRGDIPPTIQPPVPPASPVSPQRVFPQVRIEPLSADRLAEILGVQVWTARYSGGPIECWLEIEEEGQSTLPKRIPEKGYLGEGVPNPPSEGIIELYWTIREDRQGGSLHVQAGNHSYLHNLQPGSFILDWRGSMTAYSTKGSGDSISSGRDKEFEIFYYNATEAMRSDPAKPSRMVHLKLKGRFASTQSVQPSSK